MSLDAFYENYLRELTRESQRLEEFRQRVDGVLTFVEYDGQNNPICRSPDGTEVPCIGFGNISLTPGQPVATLATNGNRLVLGGGISGF